MCSQALFFKPKVLIFFVYFFMKTHFGINSKHLDEGLNLMGIHNRCFHGEIRKNKFLGKPPMWIYVSLLKFHSPASKLGCGDLLL